MNNFPIFNVVRLTIDDNASLSKHNIEAGEREIHSGEFKADICQTFNAGIAYPR